MILKSANGGIGVKPYTIPSGFPAIESYNSLGQLTNLFIKVNTTLNIRSKFGSTYSSLKFSNDYSNAINKGVIEGESLGFNTGMGSTAEKMTLGANGHLLIGSEGGIAYNGILSVNSTTKAVYLPRMSLLQRGAISGLQAGAEIYCTDCTATDAVSIFAGIALEPIAPGNMGRILKEGYISKSQIGYGSTVSFNTALSLSSTVAGGYEAGSSKQILTGVATDWLRFKAN